jgi:hypothetical protein
VGSWPEPRSRASAHGVAAFIRRLPNISARRLRPPWPTQAIVSECLQVAACCHLPVEKVLQVDVHNDERTFFRRPQEKYIARNWVVAQCRLGIQRYNYGKEPFRIPAAVIEQCEKLRKMAARDGVDLRTAALQALRELRAAPLLPRLARGLPYGANLFA